MKLNIDDMIHIDIENCYFCGDELTPETTSIWKPFAKINGDIVSVNQCQNCEKKNDEELKNGIKIDEE